MIFCPCTNLVLFLFQSIIEKCVYTASRDDENKPVTICHRDGWVSSSRRWSASVIEKFAFHKFKKSAVKSALGFEFVLNKMYNPDFDSEHKSRTEKLKDSAKKAKELAKTGAEKARSKVFVKSSCDTKSEDN